MKRYVYYKSLVRHQRYECNQEPRFYCPYCQRRAKQRVQIEAHIKRIHPDKGGNAIDSWNDTQDPLV